MKMAYSNWYGQILRSSITNRSKSAGAPPLFGSDQIMTRIWMFSKSYKNWHVTNVTHNDFEDEFFRG